MWLLQMLHTVIDTLLAWVNLAQHRQTGWLSFDRKTGRFEREQLSLMKKLKLLLLFNPLIEWLDKTHAMRLYFLEKSIETGGEDGAPMSKQRIKGFVDAYGINMDEFEPSDLDAYNNFGDFFIRAHKPGSRPITEPDDPSLATVVCDSRVVVYDSVAETKKLWIKGNEFSIASLVMDMKLGEQFSDAAVASFHLLPQDYHRYHSPVTGKIKLFRSIPGDHYEVGPIALHSKVDFLTRNRREYIVIETPEFGDVLIVAVGAVHVGSVQVHDQWQNTGADIKKGDEVGIFHFGGSSVIVAFERNTIQFDHDLADRSKQQIQSAVDVGMSLGKALSRKE